MSSDHKRMVHQEVKILDEVVNVLLMPAKYGISKNELFEYLNKYTTNNDEDEDATNLEMISAPKEQEVATKMVDFRKLLDLGRLLASKDPVSLDDLQRCLSSNVYINHLQTTSDFIPHSFSAPTLCPYYMPDLRLPIKNVLILFINYFKKQETRLTSQRTSISSESTNSSTPNNSHHNNNTTTTNNDTYETSCESMRNLMLLLNVSIVNKMVTIFKTLNPEMRLKNDSMMVKI